MFEIILIISHLFPVVEARNLEAKDANGWLFIVLFHSIRTLRRNKLILFGCAKFESAVHCS